MTEKDAAEQQMESHANKVARHQFKVFAQTECNDNI